MKKILLCTPYEGISGSNIGGIAVWAKAIVAQSRLDGGDVELLIEPIDRKTYVRGVGKLMRLLSGVKEYISLVGKVKKRIKHESPDVLHLCTTASLGLLKDYFILRYARSKGVATALHFHCGRLPEIIAKGNWETRLLRRVMKYTTVPVVMDACSHKALAEWGISSVVNLPNPLSAFVSEKAAQMKHAVMRVPRRLLFVGHVVDIKGVYELVEACTGMTGIELRMVGHVEDNVRGDLVDISSKRKGDWLVFTGGLSREDTIREILAADILVAPSYIEGFPNVIIEAMACGTPVVASKVGAIPEMLDYGNCGILIEPRNADAICSAVSGLLDNEELKASFSAKSMERVNDVYSMHTVWSQMVSIWKNI